MNLAVVSNALTPPFDEGIKRFSKSFSELISEIGGVIIYVPPNGSWIRTKLFLSREFAITFQKNLINVIIYIPTQSASLGSFLRSFVLRKISGAKVILIAMQPVQLSKLSYGFIARIAPDLILTPSTELFKFLNSLELRTEILPMGIDLIKFRPVTAHAKGLLRKKYAIPATKFVILHVGHIKPLRNLDWIINLKQNVDCFPVIVSSVSMGVDQSILQGLYNSQVYVINDYLSNIEELYQLSDCYVFPVIDNRGAVGIPLSVLEAMACNIPVVTTPFGGLPHYFPEGEGLLYASEQYDLLDSINTIQNLDSDEIQTRKKVIPYSWENISKFVNMKAQEVV